MMNAKTKRNLAKKAKFYLSKPNAQIRYEIEAFMSQDAESGMTGALAYRLTAVIMHAPSDTELNRLTKTMLLRGPNHFGDRSAHMAYADYDSLKDQVKAILEAIECVF